MQKDKALPGLQMFEPLKPAAQAASPAPLKPEFTVEDGLSYREAEVATLTAKGLSNKETANTLFVTEKTVKFHLTNIYKKMNVKSRAQLIVLAAEKLKGGRA